MCGFTALIKNKPIDKTDIDRLSAAAAGMRYRGPDESGVWSDMNVGMSHVRLSIIGVLNGHQPLVTADGRYVLICNGEIYNYRELKSKLQSRGHEFTTLSDSEVIIFSYVEYGDAFLGHLKGMFAFILYDTQLSKVIAARDISGKKPLYYAEFDDGLVFSSELKAITQNFPVDKTINYEIIRQVQENRYSISTQDTFVTSVNKVPAAHAVICDGYQISEIRQYARRNVKPWFSGSYPLAVEETRRQLFEAVARRLEAEVPIGVLLSAGIDSSAIVCIAAELGNKLQTFSASYHDCRGSDESYEAEKLAEHVGVPFQRIALRAGDFTAEFPAILDILDEPNADPALFPQWALYKAIKRRGYKVLLSGLGGDEMFFGYPQKNGTNSQDALNRPTRLRKIGGTLRSLLTLHEKRSRELLSFLLRRSFRDRAFFNKPVLREVEMLAASQGYRSEAYADYIDAEFVAPLDKTYSALCSIYLPNNGFFLSDKLAMANSIEVRCPFADQQLRNFVDSLPLDLKLPDGRAKGLLKDALRGIVPDFVLDRAKTGFTPPSSYIQSVVSNYDTQVFKQRATNFGQVVTDAMCASCLKT